MTVQPRISRLGPGSVQFGVPSGGANTSGQVPYESVLRILEMAWSAGVPEYLVVPSLWRKAESC